MTTATDTTQSQAWSALSAVYREKLTAYKAAWDIPGDKTDEEANDLHHGLMPFYRAMLTWPAATAGDLIEKLILLGEDNWDADVALKALTEDAARLAKG